MFLYELRDVIFIYSVLPDYYTHFVFVNRIELPTRRKNPGHSDVIYVVENVLNYFLWLNSSNG